MRRSLLLILFSISSIGLLQFCKHDPTELPDPEPQPCDTSNITFASTIEPILQDNCYACHSGTSPQGGLDLSDWDQFGFVVQSGAFWGAINHLPGYEPMPQGQAMLSDCEITQIGIWLEDTTWTQSGDDPCHPDTVYFQNDILPLLQSSCALSGCHDPITAQDGVILDNYDDIIQTGDVSPGDPGNSEIYENITESNPDKIMPPPPNLPLNAEQIQMVRTWIEQGALNNSCEATGPCDSLNVSFAQTIEPIIQNRCLGCHSGGNPQGGISLSTHGAVAGLAASGQLLGAITHSPGYTPMPQNGMKLNDCQIAQFRNWINNGAPNN